MPKLGAPERSQVKSSPCGVTPKVLRGCELNVKVSITWDGIHHGTRQGDTESPEYGDLSAVKGSAVCLGGPSPRGKPYMYLGTLWGNGMSMYAALA